MLVIDPPALQWLLILLRLAPQAELAFAWLAQAYSGGACKAGLRTDAEAQRGEEEGSTKYLWPRLAIEGVHGRECEYRDAAATGRRGVGPTFLNDRDAEGSVGGALHLGLTGAGKLGNAKGALVLGTCQNPKCGWPLIHSVNTSWNTTHKTFKVEASSRRCLCKVQRNFIAQSKDADSVYCKAVRTFISYAQGEGGEFAGSLEVWGKHYNLQTGVKL